jgi:hypothetical protein
MTQTDSFPLCNVSGETFFHAFRDCVKVKNLWVHFGVSGQHSFFTNLNWIDWLFENLKDVKLVRNPQWKMVFGIILVVLGGEVL